MIMDSQDVARLPSIRDLGADLLETSWIRKVVTLATPFLFLAVYFVFASHQHWVIDAICLVFVSFYTYGSTSHDLVHANLGLPRKVNDVFLTLCELIAFRSGHAYRVAHLYHHSRFPADDDVEGAAAGMPAWRALAEGLVFQLKIWIWAARRRGKEQPIILAEGFTAVALFAISLSLVSVVPTLAPYAVLMVIGSWVIPFITSYIPHNPSGSTPLEQTRSFRGIILRLVALDHLYHLEHHLYPGVPHHNWSRLAKRLDPYLEAAGVQPIKFFI